MTPHKHATRIVEIYMRSGLGDPHQSTDHAVATAVAYLELEPRFAEAKQNSEEADKISEFHIAERDHLQSLLEATEECCNNLQQRLAQAKSLCEDLAVERDDAQALLREACVLVDGCVPGYAISWDEWRDRAKEVCGE